MTTGIRFLCILVGLGLLSDVRAEDRLPGTKPLDWSEAELPARVMDGAHRFVERQIEEAAANRSRYWPDNDASVEEWTRAVETNRGYLSQILGVVDERPQPRLEYFGYTPEGTTVCEGENYRVAQVRWSAVDGVFGEGLLLSPEDPVAAAVVVPDADQTPEQLIGIAPGIPVESQLARRLLANNVEVLIPTLVNRA